MAFGCVLQVFQPKNGKKNTFLLKKWLDHMLLMTSYLVAIATDCRDSLPKYVLRINEKLLKTA